MHPSEHSFKPDHNAALRAKIARITDTTFSEHQTTNLNREPFDVALGFFITNPLEYTTRPTARALYHPLGDRKNPVLIAHISEGSHNPRRNANVTFVLPIPSTRQQSPHPNDRYPSLNHRR